MKRFSPRAKDRTLERELNLLDKFVVGYVGTHGMAHGLETLLAAADRLRKFPAGQRIRFLLIGDGARKAALRAQADDLGLTNVVFIDTVPKEHVPRYWSLLDVSFIHLRRTELFSTVIPSKLFECMGMGLPVLHGVAGESAEIVVREDVGIIFEPENVDDLTSAILRMAGQPAELARFRRQCAAAARRYDRTALAAGMLHHIESAALRTRGERVASRQTVTRNASSE
jgi:glycosyltransferase involved in cell wall biosynthesis